MFAINSCRAIRYLGRPVSVASRTICLSSKNTHSPKMLAGRMMATQVDRAIGGVMNKEFPGYFDKDHHTKPTSVLDVHDHRRELDEAAENVEEEYTHHHLTCAKVVKILGQHPAVHECVVIDINVEQHGEIPVAFVVKKPGTERDLRNDELHAQLVNSLRNTLGSEHAELEKDLLVKLDSLLDDPKIKDDLLEDELVHHVQEQVGPFAILKVVVVDDLPKTVSGKILRGTLYKIARGEPYSITPMIKDRKVLDRLEKEITGLLKDQYQD